MDSPALGEQDLPEAFVPLDFSHSSGEAADEGTAIDEVMGKGTGSLGQTT
jgi:hypothetical protein